MSFDEKSPVLMLQELCDLEKVRLTSEFLPPEINAGSFTCVVNAFDLYAKGVGRQKKEAKHAACSNLLGRQTI